MILDGPDYAAPAKLNLFLHVVGRRQDGYHLLQTAFRFLNYGDTLRFRVRQDGAIRRTHSLPQVSAEHDLTVRAAMALQRATGTRLGADIELEKRLPLGGGVGGGSSDAATTLLVLNRLWRAGLGRQALMDLGLGLGADVPVFIYGQSSFAEGVGERLQLLDLAPAWYLVITPAASVSTSEIFASPELTRNTKPIKLAAFSRGPAQFKDCHNDLEPVTTKHYPEVARCLAWLRRFAEARMTGSGACVFSSFESETAAREVLDKLPPGVTGFVAAGCDRHPLYDLAATAEA
jgi:4-diphosphocytidyl-2-C-methyl-D-erythritol kinase